MCNYELVCRSNIGDRHNSPSIAIFLVDRRNEMTKSLQIHTQVEVPGFEPRS